MKLKKDLLYPHKHCLICGKAIPESTQFCSKICEEIFEKRQRRYWQVSRVFYITMVVLLLILTLGLLIGVR